MSIKYRSDIDGLRAIAVISVIAFHLNPQWLHGGFVGVDIFFVISGFLITKIIYNDITNNDFSFKKFYQRRINRILPVFFVVMFSTAIASIYILLPDSFILFTQSLKATTYFWQNMFFAQNTGGYWDDSAAHMPILHTWSLAVEEQFYILLPFLLIFLNKIKTPHQLITKKSITLITLAIISLLSFSLSQISPKYSLLEKYNYYSLFTSRAGELLIGSIIGILSQRKKYLEGCTSHQVALEIKTSINIKNTLALIGLVMVLGSLIRLTEYRLFPGFWAVIPTIGAALVIYFHDENSYIFKFLSLKPLVFIGTISYSLYLWHWPIIVFFREYYVVDGKFGPGQYTAIILMTAFLSLLSFYLVERPCRRLNKPLWFSVILYYAIPAVIIFCMYNQKENLLKWVYHDKLEQFRLQKLYLNPLSNFCHNVRHGDCTFGDKTKIANAIMIGDSNAGHYSAFLDEAGKKYGFSIAIFSQDACWAVPGLTFKDPSVTRSCREFAVKMEHEVDKYDVIFIAGHYQYSILKKDGNENILIEYIKKLNHKGKKVIVLGQVPNLNEHEYSIFNKEFMRGQTFTSPSFLQQKELDIVDKVMIRDLQGIAEYYSPLNYLDSNNKLSWPIYNGLIGYKDSAHLNEYVTREWSEEVLNNSRHFWEGLFNNSHTTEH